MLLYAIAYESKHKGTATLHGIIAAEDAINRSAPLFDELKSGLDALLSASLITEGKAGFSLTAEGERFYAEANEIEGPVFDRLQHLWGALGSSFSGTPVNHHSEIELNEFKRAHEAYYGAAS